jgi:enamine deaminase RidA (YjgF/YER057c/UK114 family)
MATSDIYKKLDELNIQLAAVVTPAAAYVMSSQTGNTIYLSGHIAKQGGKVFTGRVGDTLSTSEGYAAARDVAIDLITTLHHHVKDLNRITRIVKLVSLVNSTPDYIEQHVVTNGASELIAEVFGDIGRHARSAFGVTQIPLGACIEIELIAEVVSV